MAEKLEIVLFGKDEFSGAFEKLKSHLPSIQTLAIGAGAAVAGLGTALYAMTSSTAGAYDKVQKLSDQLGVSTEFLSSMQVAADFSGVSISTFDKSLANLQVRTAEAVKGLGSGKAAFDTLGIALKDVNGNVKTSEQLMPELADAFNDVTNATEKTELASKVFGQRGVEMLQMFTDGSAGLEALTADAEKFGLVISADAGAKAAEFNDSLTRMKGAFEGIKNAIGEEVMPIITLLQNKLADFIAENKDAIMNTLAGAWNVFSTTIEGVAYSVAIVVDAWRGLEMTWEVLKIAFTDLSTMMLGGLNTLTETLVSFMEKFNFRGIFDDAIEGVQGFLESTQGVIEGMEEMGEASRASLAALIDEESTVEKVTNITEKIHEAIDELTAKKEEIEATSTGIAPFTEESLEKAKEQVEETMILTEEAQTRLTEMWNEYKVTDNERLDIWYKEQQDKYKGHGEALVKLKQVYDKKLADLDVKGHEAEKKRDDVQVTQKDGMFSAINSLNLDFGNGMISRAQELASNTVLIDAFTAAANAMKDYPFPANIGMAAAAFAETITWQAAIDAINVGLAHGGIDEVPKEQMYLLDKGERVLSSAQNKDLTEYMASSGQRGGSVVIESINIQVLENATNADSLLAMDKSDWEEICNDQIIPAFQVLANQGVLV